MDAIGELAKEIRISRKVTQQELADFMTSEGCPTTRDAIKHSENNGYSVRRFLLLCKRFGIEDPVSLFLGDSIFSKLNEKGRQAWCEAQELILHHKQYLKQPTVDLRMMPLSVSAGPTIDGDLDADSKWATVPLDDIPPMANINDLKVAVVSGRSMEPELYDGDHIICVTGGEPRPGHIIVCYYDYATMVKIFRSNGRESWLESLNDSFEAIPVYGHMVYYGEFIGKTTVIREYQKDIHIA